MWRAFTACYPRPRLPCIDAASDEVSIPRRQCAVTPCGKGLVKLQSRRVNCNCTVYALAA